MDASRIKTDWAEMFGERLPAVADNLTARRLVLLADETPSPHKRLAHRQPEICVVLRGAIEVQTRGQPLRLRAGSILVITPHSYHDWRAAGKSAEAMWLGGSPRHMGGSLALATADGRIEDLGGIDFLDFEPTHRLLSQAIEELRSRQPGWLRLCQGLLNRLFITALRRLGSDGRPQPASKDMSAAEIIASNARAYIQTNYREPLTLGDVAHHVALSPNYLAALFKKQLGVTVIDFLTAVRIEEAKRLLAESDAKVSRVAAQVGYHSPYYFSHAFKKATRCSPVAFRRKSAREGSS